MKHLYKITLIGIILSILLFTNACKNSEISTKTKIPEYTHPSLTLNSGQADLLYPTLVDSAIANPLNTDYTELRLTHAKSSAYDPYGDDEGLMKLRDLINAKEFEVATEVAKTQYRRLFHDPLFHYYAFIIWTEVEDEGMADIHSFYYTKLIKSVISSGDGKSAKTAYHVINISEEYRVLEYLEMEIVEQNLLEVSGHSFDEISAKDTDGKTKEIYFNIDLPFSKLVDMLE
ncbi:MAG: DUF4919 domain-containing protein [Bacteroidota bacterium]|nr:DUF4919 domain-containing protein [Bacteroidota bacterium]